VRGEEQEEVIVAEEGDVFVFRIQVCVVRSLPVIFLGGFGWEVNCNSKYALRVLW
jgi:hypothetical protein